MYVSKLVSKLVSNIKVCMYLRSMYVCKYGSMVTK